jgi:hypothetical protein
MYDTNGKEIKVGQRVYVFIGNLDFEGRVDSFRNGNAVIVDQDDEAFELDAEDTIQGVEIEVDI